MKRPFLIALPVAAIAMLLMAAGHVYTEQRPLTRLEPPGIPARSPFGATIGATGIVEAASQNIAVGSALSGVVLEVYVPAERVGEHVERGAPLFRVDDRHLKAQLALAEARLAASQAQLTKLEEQPRPEEIPPSAAKVAAAKANADRTRDEFERARSLVEHRAVSEQEAVGKRLLYEQALQDLRREQKSHELLLAGAWKPDLQIARAAVEQARAEVEQIRTEIDRATVRAPITGEVLQVNVREGEHVSDQPQQALMVVGRLDQMYVRADIDERDIPRFHREAGAVVQVRGQSQHSYPLKLVRVEPYVVAKRWLTGDNVERIDTRVLQVVYAVDGSAAPMFVGQQVDVFIEAAPAEPDSAH
ncbi:MAG TPA: HlyD family efflux transporter periplasmic adaptor subunit [Pirellulales bacterium]|nr:HlyD family efflux transporter periplasmic adaptor subunit [Pirellulales bacterium]